MLNVFLRRVSSFSYSQVSRVSLSPPVICLRSSVSSQLHRYSSSSSPTSLNLFDNLALGKADETTWDELRSKVEAGIEAKINPGKWVEIRRTLERYLEAKNDLVSLQEMADNPGSLEEKVRKNPIPLNAG